MLKKLYIKFIFFFYYLFKKVLFFIKFKKLNFLYFFLKTEFIKIINKYFNKKFNNKYLLICKNYNSSNFITHNSSTKRWFKHNIIYILLLIKKFNLDLVKNNILEIGSYEGNSTIFFLKYLKYSSITCVDSWSDFHTAGNKNRELKFDIIKENFNKNIKPYKNRTNIHHCLSKDFFIKNRSKYDLVYIDGSHTFEDVLNDGNNAVKLLNNNGLIIFDDVFKSDVFKAILEIYSTNNLKIELVYHQVVFRYIEKK